MSYLLNNLTGEPAKRVTEFNISKKRGVLFVNFKSYQSSLFCSSDKDNGPLYNGCVNEIFIQINNSDSYLEIEVAPNGKTFVASILNREITFIDNSFVKANVVVKDDNYFVDIKIDLSKYQPKEIKYNAFRIERKDDQGEYELYALSSTLCGTFHVKEKFIKL